MHATIRRYGRGDGAPEAGVRTWRDLVALPSNEDGFVSFVVQATGEGGLAAVTLFDDAATLAAADRRVEDWLAARAGDLARLMVQITTGEVVAQRGRRKIKEKSDISGPGGRGTTAKGGWACGSHP